MWHIFNEIQREKGFMTLQYICSLTCPAVMDLYLQPDMPCSDGFISTTNERRVENIKESIFKMFLLTL
jgi:hypothetical protein